MTLLCNRGDLMWCGNQHGTHAAPLRGHLQRGVRRSGVIQSKQIRGIVRSDRGGVVNASRWAGPF